MKKKFLEGSVQEGLPEKIFFSVKVSFEGQLLSNILTPPLHFVEKNAGYLTYISTTLQLKAEASGFNFYAWSPTKAPFGH